MCLEKFVKKLAGITKLEDGLTKLDKMTNEEARLANAEVMRLSHIIDMKVEGVDEKVQGVGAQVKDVDEKVQGVGENVKVVEGKVQTIIDGAQHFRLVIDTITNFELSRWRSSGSNLAANRAFVMASVFTDGQVSNTITETQLREGLTKWQSPSDPSTNHNFACDRQHEGTAEWFCRGTKFEAWKVAGSLLWIHGKRMLFFFLTTSMT